jgi:hypothetical protein
LHGPIELISKKGVYAFRDARHICASEGVRETRLLGIHGIFSPVI